MAAKIGQNAAATGAAGILRPSLFWAPFRSQPFQINKLNFANRALAHFPDEPLVIVPRRIVVGSRKNAFGAIGDRPQRLELFKARTHGLFNQNILARLEPEF